MKKYFFITIVFCGLITASCKCQNIDTLVDAGGYKLFFHIIKGKGMPILFEAGAGGETDSWDTLIKPLANVTGATLITYDRAGFGKSELDTSNQEIDGHTVLNGIKGLETALAKMGYDKNIMVVGHSYGGFCAALYAARHPDKVKAAVLIDANLVSWFTDEYVKNEMIERRKTATELKASGLATYYRVMNLQNTVEILRKAPFPATIPVIDLVSQFNFPDSAMSTRWAAAHKQFTTAETNREGITAHGSGHFIFRDNLLLVVGAFVKMYTAVVAKEQAEEIRQRFVSYSVESANNSKQAEMQFRHSADDLLSWGNSLLQHGEKVKAVEVFKLNVLLYPGNSQGFESLGEAYETVGDKENAIKNYKQVIEMDKGNKVAEERLKKILSVASVK